MKGRVVNEQTGGKKMFNDAGELIKALGQWNAEQYRSLRDAKKSST